MTREKRRETADLTYAAMGAALIAVCPWISVPTTVPFTTQTFAVFCVLSAMGGRRGLMAIAVYLLLGAAGLPVFAGSRGGLGVLLGVTGGYIVGFLFTGIIYALAERRLGGRLWPEAGVLALGMAVCYAFGTAWFMVAYARASGPVGLGAALGMCVAPFLLPDMAKLALALYVSRRVRALSRRPAKPA